MFIGLLLVCFLRKNHKSLNDISVIKAGDEKELIADIGLI